MSRPIQFVDALYDFGPNGTTQNSITIGTPGVVVFNTISTDKISYKLLSEDNVYIDNAGNQVTLTYLNAGDGITRRYYNPGLNTDQLSLYDRFVTNHEVDTQTFNYYSFQQAIAILKETTYDPLGTVVTNGAIKSNLQINDIVSFSIASSRGKELGEVATIYIKNTSGTYVAATQGLDFDVATGHIGVNPSASFSIKILKQAEYRLDYIVNGYHSNNHPFTVISEPRGLILSNQNKVSYFLNSFTSPYNISITLPIINPVFNSNIVLSSTPFSTYEQNNFTIEGILNVTTGKWIQTDVVNGTISSRTLNLNDWLDELAARCNVSLEVKNFSGTYSTSLNGLGPHSLSLPSDNYIANFKVTSNQTATCITAGVIGGTTLTLPPVVWDAAYQYRYEVQLIGTPPFTLTTSGNGNYIANWVTATIDNTTKKLIITASPDLPDVGAAVDMTMSITNCGTSAPLLVNIPAWSVYQARYINTFNFQNDGDVIYQYSATLNGSLLTTPVNIDPAELISFTKTCQYKADLIVTIVGIEIPSIALLSYPDNTVITGIYNSSNKSFTFSNINTQVDNQSLTISFQ